MTNKTPDKIDKVERIEEILAAQLERRSTGMLENHAQTLIVFIILGVMSWVGYSINQTNVSVEVLKNDVSYMKAALDKASSTHVNLVEFRVSTGQLQEDLAETKARLKLLEDTYYNPSRK